MKWQCKVWKADGDGPVVSNFLSDAAISFLENAEDAIFEEWKRYFPKDKSLANVMAKTVLRYFDQPGPAFGNADVRRCTVLRAFHHQKSSSDLWVEMFRQFNHDGVADCLVLTQTDAFKQKFLYDSSTMCTEFLANNYRYFLSALNLRDKPTVYFLAFDDLGFHTDVLNRGTKKYLKLERY